MSAVCASISYDLTMTVLLRFVCCRPAGPEYVLPVVDKIPIVKTSEIMDYIDQDVEIVAIVAKVGLVQDLATTYGTSQKRELQVFDKTKKAVKIVLFGRLATEFAGLPTEVVHFHRLHVTEFRGAVELSTRAFSRYTVDPPSEQCDQLKVWARSVSQAKKAAAAAAAAAATSTTEPAAPSVHAPSASAAGFQPTSKHIVIVLC